MPSSRIPPPKLIIPSKSEDHNEMTPPTTPKSACASTPSSLVASVLSRLSRHHPNLRPPSLSDRSKFLEKATALPDLPEWMWYGLLNYSIRLDSALEQEVVDFGILDEFLDCDAGEDGGVMSNPPAKMWDVLFFYMYLHLESGRGGDAEGAVKGVVPLTPPATEDGESGIEDAGRKELRRSSYSKPSPSSSPPRQEVLPLTQQPQARGWDVRDWLILFLLLVVTVLLALSFTTANRLQVLGEYCTQALAPIRAYFTQALTHARAAVAETYSSSCQAQCKKMVDVLMDNVGYRLGVTKLPGTATTAATSASTARSEL